MQRGVEAARGLVFSKRTYNAACLERLLGISLSLPLSVNGNSSINGRGTVRIVLARSFKSD